jgi:mannose-6-phosphate isomerase-like protein (cupin superfamily)
MKIAMLSCIDNTIPPIIREEREERVHLLTNQLLKKGIQIALFTLKSFPNNDKRVEEILFPFESLKGSKPDVWEYLCISSLFEHSDDFDLIHNHNGFLPLTYMGKIKTPTITTLYEAPPSSMLPVYKKYNNQTFYLAYKRENKHRDIKYYATIDDNTENNTMFYFELYQKIIQQTQQESHRPWGFYKVISDANDHKVKRITVYPGQRLSYQRHHQRSEHWYIIKGQSIVTKDGNDINLMAGQSIDLPVKTWHRIRNPGNDQLVFIEIQTGEYFGEDDIERAADDYGRS